jgi:hypothetical protein
VQLLLLSLSLTHVGHYRGPYLVVLLRRTGIPGDDVVEAQVILALRLLKALTLRVVTVLCILTTLVLFFLLHNCLRCLCFLCSYVGFPYWVCRTFFSTVTHNLAHPASSSIHL